MNSAASSDMIWYHRLIEMI